MQTQQTKVCQEFDDNYNLVVDSCEVEHILTNYVCPDDRDDYGSLFVKVGEGEYLEIWGSEHQVPWVDITYYRVQIADGSGSQQ